MPLKYPSDIPILMEVVLSESETAQLQPLPALKPRQTCACGGPHEPHLGCSIAGQVGKLASTGTVHMHSSVCQSFRGLEKPPQRADVGEGRGSQSFAYRAWGAGGFLLGCVCGGGGSWLVVFRQTSSHTRSRSVCWPDSAPAVWFSTGCFSSFASDHLLPFSSAIIIRSRGQLLLLLHRGEGLAK